MKAPVDRELLARLPKTFAPALNEKLRGWNVLFPAEQRLLRAEIDWLRGLDSREFDSLFAAVNALERRMDLPRWSADADVVSIEDVATIARSPLYPEWRTEVEKAFVRIDDAAEKSGALKRINRLVLCILPAGLPYSQSLWTNVGGVRSWISLDRPFGEIGAVRAVCARAFAHGLDEVESTWVLECGTAVQHRSGAAATVLSWSGLDQVRREFLDRLNTIHKSLKSADDATRELRRADISRHLDPNLARDIRVREFVRALLLSGNGSLVFNNSFVQWGASEALRRAEPQVVVAMFGVRAKPKPFSSLVLFEDQVRSNPAPDAPDLPGSLTDGAKLAEYVYLTSNRLAAYNGRTITIFAVMDLDRMLVIAPTSDRLPPSERRMTPGDFTQFVEQWLGGSQT